MVKLIRGAVALVLMAAGLCFAELQQTCKNDNVREKPFIDGKVVIVVKTGQAVDVQKREGSWYFVKVGTKTGWLPMLSVRRTKAAAPVAASRQTGRSSTGSVVNTTGVRGLSEQTLTTAVFSDSAVAAAEKNRVLPNDAAVFAAAAGITVQAVPTLFIPPKTPSIPGGVK